MKSLFARIHTKVYLVIFLIGSGIIYLKVLSPVLGITIPCVFRKITGFYCPGCGMTRASLALLEGDIYQAFRYNMIIFIILPLLILFYVLEKKGKERYSQLLMGAMLFMTILFGVLRNFDVFSWLMPTRI